MGQRKLIGGAILGLLGGLAWVTNPGPEAQAGFAQGLASRYLQEDLCNQDLPIVGRRFAADCQRLAGSAEVQAELKTLLAENTDRHNFGLFSLYDTDLSLQSLVPGLPKALIPPYQVRVIGLFGQFVVYQAGSVGAQ
jgi:hypothetical protein